MTLSANIPLQFHFHDAIASDEQIKKSESKEEAQKPRPMLKTKTENEQVYLTELALLMDVRFFRW